MLSEANEWRPDVSIDDRLLNTVRFIHAFAEQYLQSPLQLQHACDLLLSSELFAFHSERMSEILTDDTQTVSHIQIHFLVYNPV